MVRAGLCRLTALQAGNQSFNSATAAIQTFTIAPGPQAVLTPAASPASISFNGTTSLSATGGSGTGAVSFAVISGGGFCSVAGNALTGTGVGTCTVTATKAADANFTAISATVDVTVGPAAQAALTAAASPASIAFNGTSTLSATGGSGTGSVNFAVTSGGAFCSLAGNTLTGIGVGTCTVTASKAADANFSATSATVDITVGRAAQAALAAAASPTSINFNGTSTLSATGGSGTGAVNFAVTSGGAFCSVAGNALTGTGVGTCTVTATKAADANFTAISATVDVTVGPAVQAALSFITTPSAITALSGPVTLQTSGGSGTGAVSFAVTSGGGDCSVTNDQLSCTGVGTATITASKAADINFGASSATTNVSYDTTPVVAGAEAASDAQQTTTISTVFATPLSVKVTDALGRPISGVVVTFTVPASGPSATLSASTATTDNNGLAKIVVRANDQPGSYTVTAKTDGGQTVAFSLSNNRDATADIRQTQSAVSGFIARRADQILTGEPALTSRLTGISRSVGSVIGLTGTGDSQNAQVTFSFSLRGALDVARKKNLQQIPGHTGTLELAGSTLPQFPELSETGFDLWAEGKLVRTRSGPNDATSSIIYGGVDYRFSSQFLVGLMVQHDWTDEATSTQNTSANGKGWLAGPYMVARLHQNVLFDGRIAWGQSTNTINALGLTNDTFESTRWLAHGRLTGDFSSGSWRFNPHADVTYFEEEQHAYLDGLNNIIPGQTIALGRLTFGPKISYQANWSDGSSLRPFLGVNGIWDFKSPDNGIVQGAASGSTDGLRARIEGGVSARTPFGLTIDAKGFYDGINKNSFQAYGGSLRATMPID